MNPALGPISTTFQSFYASSPLLDIASLLLGMEVKDMQMELFNLLINPSSHYFALGWHRDDIKPDVTPEEEEERLRRPTYGVQFNTALYDDDCLFIVPGTHRRVRTKEEARANMAKAPPAVLVTEAEGFDGGWEVDPPNTFRVKLKAGETVFYSQRILHRASYGPKAARATLHGCFGDASEGGEGTKERARNVLQHGVEWMREPSFVEGLEERVKPSEYHVWLRERKRERILTSEVGLGSWQCGQTSCVWTLLIGIRSLDILLTTTERRHSIFFFDRTVSARSVSDITCPCVSHQELRTLSFVSDEQE